MKHKISKVGIGLVLIYIIFCIIIYIGALSCEGFICGIGIALIGIPWVFITVDILDILKLPDIFSIIIIPVILNVILFYFLGVLIEKIFRRATLTNKKAIK